LSNGLLKAANEILVKLRKEEAKAAAPAKGRGLLNLANIFLNRKETAVSKDGKQEKPKKGLLAIASSYIKTDHALLAAGNLSLREVETDNSEQDDGQGFLFDMEVVSPFSSMFSSLDNGKENSTSSTNAD